METLFSWEPSELTAHVESAGIKQRPKPPVLWLCMAHPCARLAGSSTYSAGLLRATAAAGQPITLLTYGEGPAIQGVQTISVPPPRRPRVLGIGSTLPASAWALASPEARHELARLLGAQEWRAAVVDHAAMAWTVPAIRATRIPLVYVSHNHEASVRPAVARAETAFARRPLMLWDAKKFAWLEKNAVGEAALVTAITEADAAQYRREGSSAPILTLTPGYTALEQPPRSITEETPRRVVLVGRYDWVAKQANLQRWAAEGVPILGMRGVETVIAGHVPEALQARLRQPGLRFLGEVQNLSPILADARVGLVAEELGGGFKMKTLDYIHHGLPVAALAGNLAGIPSNVQDFAIQEDTRASLAQAILSEIDDIPRLNTRHRGALQAARQEFDWDTRGVRFAAAVAPLRLRSPGDTP